MNKEETLALWTQGKDAWNAWAQRMLDQRAEMENVGTWASRRDMVGSEEPDNEPTGAWLMAAVADFREYEFGAEKDFTNTLFPADAHFDKIRFEKDARFDSATFSGNAWFFSATFSGNASFNDTKFYKSAWFVDAIFNENAWFANAIFSGNAWFHIATFGRIVLFHNTTFSGNAGFRSATFRGDTEFTSATFSGDAGFEQSFFRGNATFTGTTFCEQANFASAHGERGFTLEGARFAKVPDFVQAHFSEAPRLDNMRIRPGKGDANLSARYRALKRLAIDAHDHAREQEYFAGELRALRGHPDKLLPNPLNWIRRDEEGKRLPAWPGGARYWFGLFYQGLSDFGRSIVLPLIWLGVTAFVCAWCYLGLHFRYVAEHGQAYGLSSLEWIGRWIVSLFAGSPPLLSCVDGSFGEPWVAARLLSLAKTLPYTGVVPAEKLTEVFACLYGSSIPSCVVVIGMVQLVLSLLLLFLFLLAVRNHFRIR